MQGKLSLSKSNSESERAEDTKYLFLKSHAFEPKVLLYKLEVSFI